MKQTSTIHWKKEFKIILYEIAGSFLISLGLYNFAVAAGFPMTGFSGAALIIYRLTGFPIGLTTILLNIPVSILVWKLLGKGFLIRSFRCMLIESLMIDYLMPLLPVYTGGRLLSAVCCGVLTGIGYGIIYKGGSSTAGLDFITMAIKVKHPHLQLGTINFAADFIIVVLAGLLFKDYDGIIYGLIINYLLARVIDRIMFGANAGKMLITVTDKAAAVSRTIDKAASRGSTILEAYGGFHQDAKHVVLCACSNREVYPIEEAIKETDPASFIIILDSSEVHGEGFHYTTVGKG